MRIIIAAVATLLALAFAAPALAAGKKTVCTITVNSPDEKETFRQRLPKGEYEFVELVEKGRADWLRSSCQRGVRCDVLVVSGHFNAGDTFYSDQLANNEYLEIDELERASCSASCPDLFSRLKEVYLFGCESLNPDATRYASSYGESGRDRMRRIFAGVPVIYGFSSSAPVGPTAAMLLRRYFDTGARGETGSGRPSARLLRAFGRNSMTHVAGARSDEPLGAQRPRVCGFFDERLSPAGKLEHVHRILREEDDALSYVKRIERLLASFGEAERRESAFLQALATISADEVARSRYVAAMRRAPQPGTRARMIELGATLGWFSPEAQRRERVALVNDLLAAPSMGYAEVDLVCSLNASGELDGEVGRLRVPASKAGHATHAAALACLGSDEAHGRIVRALASADERDVRIAQVYLRHRPVSEQGELRALARDVARMPGSPAAQVRALDTLARLRISDREILEELSRAFAESKSVNVQRAIAEVFLRSDARSLPRREIASILREHRLGRGPDLIDAAIAKLGG